MKIRNFSLVTKQVLGFGLILVFLLGVNIFSLFEMSQLKQDVDDVTKLWLPSVIAVSEINTESSAFRIAELQHAFSNEEAEMRLFEELMIEKKQQISQIKENYESLISTDRERELFKKISNEWQAYTELNDEFLQLSIIGIKEEAVFFLNDKALHLFNELTTDLNELVKLNKKYAFDSAQTANITYNSTKFIIIALLLSTIIISIIIGFILVKAIIQPIQLLEKGVKNIAEGNDEFELQIFNNDEIGNLAQSFNKMTKALRKAREENQLQDWIKSGQNQLNEIMRSDVNLSALSRNVITFLSQYIKAQIGALYLWKEDEKVLKLEGSYAFSKRKHLGDKIKLGEGLVGQAAMEKQIISVTNIPEGYIEINSALGSIPPKNIVSVPFLYENQLIGVIEFGTFNTIERREMDLFDIIMKNIAMGFNSAISRNKIRFLLEESQIQAKELKKQQLRLTKTNSELEEQTLALIESEAELQAQREELQTTNEELEDKTNYLERHKKEIVTQNQELEEARNNITKKAKELEEISKYKSEFLANMSHELRTPLNSLLILARNLSENKSKNLTEDQIESSKIILNSGKDLLELINEILDLSKIEAGKMSLNLDKFRLSDFKTNVYSTFNHMIEEKNLYLNINFDEYLPEFILSDYQKITQVIKNLMSNSIKFTNKGGIIFSVFEEKNINLFSSESLKMAKAVIGFSVKDTGIGIKEDKLIAVFEAFQQADGSTSRKFGGTGLGLSISRQLVKLLGGEIMLSSEYGNGSEFTFYIPAKAKFKKTKKTHIKKVDSQTNGKEEKTLAAYSETKKNYKKIFANTYDDRLKITEKDKVILSIEDDISFNKALHKLCNDKGFKFLVANSGKKGIELAQKFTPAAIVLNLRLPGISGWEVLEILKEKSETRKIPVHIISSEELDKELTEHEHIQLNKYVNSISLKSLKSEERLLDETALFLHRVIDDLPEHIQKIITDIHTTKEDIFKDKKILIVDDDMRNVFALSKILKEKGLNIIKAEDGKKALQLLKENKDTKLILMDIMMPVMDGYTAMTEIRKIPEHIKLPIIALTAKAMKEDKEKCMAAGATDYLSKPVNMERLISLIRVWLYN